MRGGITTTPAVYSHECTKCGKTTTRESQARIPGWVQIRAHDHYGTNGNSLPLAYLCRECYPAMKNWLTLRDET